MNETKKKFSNIRIHLTNITGLGARILLHSLLPEFEQDKKFKIHEFHLPSKNTLSEYKALSSNTKTIIYNRKLPFLISRAIECLFTMPKYNDGVPVIVFGDIPLKISNGKQIVFLHSSLLVTPWFKRPKLETLKYIISRLIFRINLKYIDGVAVQTTVMKDKLLSIFPKLIDKIHVIPQPVPTWLKNINFDSVDKSLSADQKINLIYPAATYPHKNHKIFSKIDPDKSDWPISKITLTIDESENPAPEIKWIKCSGMLDHDRLIEEYKNSDALLFLSLEESFGFPLIEAMHLNMPIICADLPYSRILCGDDAIYFAPNDINSLENGIIDLHQRLIDGWQPDWADQLKNLPKDWKSVADKMIDLCL